MPVLPKKYGVRLVHYRGQPFGLFIFEGVGRWSGTLQEAEDKAKEYRERNPDGYYCEEELTD